MKTKYSYYILKTYLLKYFFIRENEEVHYKFILKEVDKNKVDINNRFSLFSFEKSCDFKKYNGEKIKIMNHFFDTKMCNVKQGGFHNIFKKLITISQYVNIVILNVKYSKIKIRGDNIVLL